MEDLFPIRQIYLFSECVCVCVCVEICDFSWNHSSGYVIFLENSWVWGLNCCIDEWNHVLLLYILIWYIYTRNKQTMIDANCTPQKFNIAPTNTHRMHRFHPVNRATKLILQLDDFPGARGIPSIYNKIIHGNPFRTIPSMPKTPTMRVYYT